MKRIRNLFILAMLIAVTFFGCNAKKEEREQERQERNKPHLVSSYELVAAKINSQTQVSGDISGTYLLCFGGMSGNIETRTTKVYNYWYKREDGGIIPDTIDMSSYKCPENVKIVIYEDDSATPKVELWRNYWAERYGDGDDYSERTIITEFRFTIPSGSFVNTYDFQGNSENSQNSQ